MYAALEDGEIAVYNTFLFKDVIKEIQGRSWDAGKKAWILPNNESSLSTLRLIGCEFRGELKDIFASIKGIDDKANIPTIPIEPMPLKVRPYKHQVQAFNFAGRLLGIFNGGDA
jgi:hypothetical protein